MAQLEVLNIDNAPESAKPILSALTQKFGFLPNLAGVLANSPGALKAYVQLVEAWGATSFTPIEQNLLAVAVSRVNGCGYCAAAHSTLLKKVGADPDLIGALAEGHPLADPKLEALRRFATVMVEKRGQLDHERDVQPFLDAGYSREQILEVLIPVAMKTIGNFTNNIAHTPLDPQFGG